MVLTRVIADFRTNPEGGYNACNCIMMLMRREPRRSAKEPRGLADGEKELEVDKNSMRDGLRLGIKLYGVSAG